MSGHSKWNNIKRKKEKYAKKEQATTYGYKRCGCHDSVSHERTECTFEIILKRQDCTPLFLHRALYNRFQAV